MIEQAKVNHYLSVKLDNELFGISVLKVLEVLEKQHITKVPNMPGFIKGVINFRGEILPVIEARSKFNMVERAEGAKFVIVVVDIVKGSKNSTMGIIADSVKDVLEIKGEEIMDIPDMGTNYDPEFLSGMVKQEADFLMLLDIDKVFSVEDMAQIQEQIEE